MAGFAGSNNIGVYTLASGEFVSEARLAEGIPRLSAGVSQLSAQALCMRLEVVSGALPVVAFDQVGQFGMGHDPSGVIYQTAQNLNLGDGKLYRIAIYSDLVIVEIYKQFPDTKGSPQLTNGSFWERRSKAMIRASNS